MNEPLNETELSERLRAIDVPAPQHLHERVQAMVQERAAPARRRTRSWGLAGAAAAAAALAIALVLALGGSSGGGLSMSRATALTQSPATQPAPAESPHRHSQLAVSVDGIPFPYWDERFGWKATGARVDRVAGRTVTTVFYADRQGRRVGYAIVHGTPAPQAAAGPVQWWHGTAFHIGSAGGATVVSWYRSGHLCVLAARGVPSATLLRLAAWHDRAAAV